MSKEAAWPNQKPNLENRKHRKNKFVHTWGLQKESRLRCVDNSKLGMAAMAEGKPPYIINVFSYKHHKVSMNTTPCTTCTTIIYCK